ncbi:hypothetical protein [Haladaptatus halobius]|uniref:hypothetical protein n=1 Tax=Haladaptatus halobius TaxID=2884875 RepID=UPI001D0A5C82|nr:hypothetical protein [Haladaptatus halobius]
MSASAVPQISEPTFCCAATVVEIPRRNALAVTPQMIAIRISFRENDGKPVVQLFSAFGVEGFSCMGLLLLTRHFPY